MGKNQDIEPREYHPELFVSLQEYADQERLTLQTVQVWAGMGRLETVMRNGERFINTTVPLKPSKADGSMTLIEHLIAV
jgi:hypothetical protein